MAVSRTLARMRAARPVHDFGSILPVFIGVLQPLDFVSEVDGYMVYLKGSEVMYVYAWGWAFYLGLGLLAAAAFSLGVGLVGMIFRGAGAEKMDIFRRWAVLAIVGCAFARVGKVWLGTFPGSETAVVFLGQYKLVIAAVIIALAYGGARKWVKACGQLLWGARFLAVIGGLIVVLGVGNWATFGGRSTVPPVPAPAWSAARPPDIILITLDALGAGKMSLYGHQRPTTPRLEGVAADFQVFNRYYANSNFTTPSVNSLMHGIRPWTHRANQIVARLDPAVSANGLVAHLKRAGYETVSIATNPAATAFNNDNNAWFDHQAIGLLRVSAYVGIAKLGIRFPNAIPVFTQYAVTVTTRLLDRGLVAAGIWSHTDHFDLQLPLAAARRAVEQRKKEQPLFLWVHLLVPHDPYAAPEPFLGRFDASAGFRTRFNSSIINGFSPQGGDPALVLLGRYEESIAYADQNVGDFLDWLKQQNLYQDAIVAITSDHGESFSHGYAGHGGPMLVEDLIHLPLLIKPATPMPGRRWDSLAEQVDLTPTLLDLAGIRASRPHEGKSLAPVMAGQPANGAVYAMNFERNSRFGRLHRGTIAMLEGQHKYIRYLDVPAYPNRTAFADQLFDVINDPGERVDLMEKQPAVAQRMRAQIDQQLEERSGTRQ